MGDEGMEDAFLSSSESEKEPIANYNAILDLKPKTHRQKTVVGEIRNIKRFTWLEWVFVAVGALTFLSTLGLTIERFVHFKMLYNDSHNASEGDEELGLDPCHSWTCLSDVTFSGLLVANIVFCFLYGVDGLLREKGFELLGVIGAIILIIVYLTSNFIYHMVDMKDGEFSKGELAIRIVRLVISLVLGPILAILSLFIYFKMGQLTFTIVGGNRELMRAYKMMSFLSTLLFFNVQAVVSIIILAFVRHGTFISEAEKIILPIMTVYVIILTPLGYIGVLYEMTKMTIVFLVLMAPTTAYYVFKIVDVARHFSGAYQFDKGVDNHYDFIAMTIIVICFLALILLILIGIFGVLVLRNFGKGLKEKIDLPFFWCYQKLNVEKN